MDYNNLKIGQKVVYTGDMANLPAEGEIVRFDPSGYDIELINVAGEKRTARCISPVMFEKSPGRRFLLWEEYQANRQARIDELKAKFAE